MFIIELRAHDLLIYWLLVLHNSVVDSHDDNDNDNDDEMQKTLAILIGLIAGVALVIVFLSCLAKLCDRKGANTYLFHIIIPVNLNLITDYTCKII